jgi:putative membrane protein
LCICSQYIVIIKAIPLSFLKVRVINQTQEKEMTTITNIFVGFVAFLHVYFLVLEMFLWDKPFGRRTFGLTPEFASASKSLAANQGLYNGFLAAGLVWGLSLGVAGSSIKLFFLGCVIVAGVFGGLTANRKILWVQALPGAIAFALVLLS